jgi:hypothetical protein
MASSTSVKGTPACWLTTAYASFIALAVLVPFMLCRDRTAAIDKATRKLPVPECLTAGVAAAAWGLVMPGSPLAMVLNASYSALSHGA